MPSPPDLETSLNYCTYCPKLCRHTCPVSNAEAREEYLSKIAVAKAHICDGDAFEICLTHHLEAPFAGDPFALWQEPRGHAAARRVISLALSMKISHPSYVSRR